jgi:hypothetical protein
MTGFGLIVSFSVGAGGGRTVSVIGVDVTNVGSLPGSAQVTEIGKVPEVVGAKVPELCA